MKKQLTIMAASLLTIFNSCSKSGGTSTPVTPTPAAPISTFNITINGHSYHLSGYAPLVVASNPSLSSSSLQIGGSTVGGSSQYQFGLTCSDLNKSVAVTIAGYKTDMSSAIGTYYSGYDSSSSGISNPGGTLTSNFSIIDYGDGGKIYTNYYGVYGNTISTMNISISNGSELKGTFNLKLSYNGAIYNITGDFDYKH